VFGVPAGVTAVGAGSGGSDVAGPADVPVDVAAGSAAIRVVSTTISDGVDGRPAFYGVTATVRPDEQSIGSTINAVKNTGGSDVRSDGTVRLVFVASTTADPTKSALTITTAGTEQFVDTGRHVAQVVVRDASGNPIQGKPVTFEWAIGTIEGPGAGGWTTVDGPLSNASGISSVEIAAPDHKAVWIWVRASVAEGAGTLPVGPTGNRTIVGAEFVARSVNPSKTAESFQTYLGEVDNDLTATSWAQVVVQDQYGNGIGGVDVTFTLPASQAGALGTPVFLDGNTPPTSKTITITSCAKNLTGTIPDQCKSQVDGEYTPGLAIVKIVSDYEGVFTVSGTVPVSGEDRSAGSGPVTFKAPEGDWTKSSFTLEKTDASAPRVVANGTSSYTVTATIMGETATGLKPASGECVTPTLPSQVRVKSPTPSSAGCATGSFVTDVAGQVKFQIVTTVAGTWPIGVQLAGHDVPTEPDGDVFIRPALFVGAEPSATFTELTSPDLPVRADDPAGQTVLVTVRDAYGNLAACWDSVTGDQIPCDVDFFVPARVRAGTTNGPATVLAQTGLIDFSLVNPTIADIAARLTFLGEEGSYPVTATVNGVYVLIADGVTSTNGPASARIRFTDATDPGQPVVNPSDGGHVDGNVPPEDLADAADGDLTVVVKDGDGNVLATCPVGGDGTFDCPIVPKVPDGTELVVVIEDGAGNQTNPPVEIITDGVAPGQPVVNPSDGGHVDGQVPPEDLDDAANGDLTVVVKDEDGNVVATCPVAADGSFDCPIVPKVPDGTELVVVVEDPAHNATEPPVKIVTDGEAPDKPTVDESDGNHVTGEVGDGDKGDAADGNLEVVITDDDGNVIATCPVLPNGKFDCPIEPSVPDGEGIHVVIVDPAGNTSNPVDKVVDGVPPGAPTIDESNGVNVTGSVAEEDRTDAAHGDLTVVVTDEDGNVVTTCAVGTDGTFNCPINPRLPDGAEVTVEIVDKAGNHNDSNIVIDGVAPGTPVLDPSRGDEVSGLVPVEDLDDAADGKLVVVVTDPSTGAELCQAQVAADGTWSCTFDPAIPDGTVVEVTLVDKAGNVSGARELEVDSTAPIPPSLEPSEGETLTGLGEEQGNQITVKDGDGNVLCTATVGADRSWSCDLEPAASVGDVVTVEERDTSGNVITGPWRIGIPEIAVAKPTLCMGDRQSATGLNFQPGETVTAVTSGEVPVGSLKANAEGMVVFQWVVPEGTPRNVHILTLRGPLSGVHTTTFEVTCGGPPADIQPPTPAPVPPKPQALPFTGADGILGMTGAALGLLLAGLLLFLAAKRRRRNEEPTEA
ncbi:MAG: Ig-like domain-containing protein, partial [Bifidobacteriaceae bacterium]|jgi:hypothetical protein|nr:Ig-like domain-containing protein [Bifidobacteriaceae bacterium]